MTKYVIKKEWMSDRWVYFGYKEVKYLFFFRELQYIYDSGALTLEKCRQNIEAIAERKDKEIVSEFEL